MRFENSFWRLGISAICIATGLSLMACERPATNTSTPTPTSAPSASPNIISAGTAPATPSSSIALATPAAAAASPVIPGPTPIPFNGKDYDVTMLNGSKTTLSKMLGRKKIMVVNFWATWCGPCRREIPDLIALANEYKSKNVEVVGLTVEDPAQTMTLVKEFTKQTQINYTIGFAPTPMFMMFNGVRPGGPIPQTFIFDKNGKLLYHIPGMRPAYKDYVAQAIDLALKS